MPDVLVPLDGSLVAQAALRVAFAVAERDRSRVVAIQVEDRGRSDDPHDYLAGAIRRFAAVAPHATRVVQGAPADAIVSAANDDDALICMATHGRGGLSRLALGSVAEEVLRRARREVLLVGPLGGAVPLSREKAALVIGSDGSDTAAALVQPAASFAQRLDLDCAVVQVVEPDEAVAFDEGPPPSTVRTEAQASVGRFCRELLLTGVTATAEVRAGEPCDAIIHYARSLPASFIAVATHGRRGLSRLAMGSVAADVVRRAPCPVLVVRGSSGEL